MVMVVGIEFIGLTAFVVVVFLRCHDHRTAGLPGTVQPLFSSRRTFRSGRLGEWSPGLVLVAADVDPARAGGAGGAGGGSAELEDRRSLGC